MQDVLENAGGRMFLEPSLYGRSPASKAYWLLSACEDGSRLEECDSKPKVLEESPNHLAPDVRA